VGSTGSRRWAAPGVARDYSENLELSAREGVPTARRRSPPSRVRGPVDFHVLSRHFMLSDGRSWLERGGPSMAPEEGWLGIEEASARLRA